MKSDWSQFLREVYRLCRNAPAWLDLYILHDIEDQNYFDMLDERKNRMIMAEWRVNK